jgi:predicted transcriptional regulator
MSDDGGLTPEQCRAARAWLGWSQQDLADKAPVALSTVKDFESGRRRPIRNNLAAMVKAFTEAGIVFLPASAGRLAGIRGPGIES